jgi:hypothetical protein
MTTADVTARAGFRTRRFLLITVVAAVAAFMLGPQAPLGQLVWPATVDLDPAPAGAQVGLFMLLGVIEALAFGAGLAILILGRAIVRRFVPPGRTGLATATHLALFWMLGNWWLHDGLHMVAGLHTGPLLAVEYAFHVTLIAAAGVLTYALATAATSTTPSRHP